MGLSLSSIVKNVWNVFSNRSPTGEYKDIGSGYSYRPDRFRLTREMKGQSLPQYITESL